MNTIDHFGKELVLKPILKVRVRFRDGKWFVEYCVKKWLFKFWSVENSYRDFADAKAKAIALKAQGGIFILRDVKLEWDIGDEVPVEDDQPPIPDEDGQ